MMILATFLSYCDNDLHEQPQMNLSVLSSH